MTDQHIVPKVGIESSWGEEAGETDPCSGRSRLTEAGRVEIGADSDICDEEKGETDSVQSCPD